MGLKAKLIGIEYKQLLNLPILWLEDSYPMCGSISEMQRKYAKQEVNVIYS